MTETVIVTVTEVQIPADSSAWAQRGPDRDGPGGRHDGGYETEWAILIEWFQGTGTPTGSQGGDNGGGSGNNGGGTVTGGGPTSGNTGNAGNPTSDGGSGTSTSSDTGGTTSDSNPGTPSTPESSSTGSSQAVAATPVSSPAENGNATKPHPVSSTSSVAPAASTPTASAALAAAAIEPTPATVEAAAARPAEVHHELVARADLHPEAVAAVLNQPAASNIVRADYLAGGTEQLAVMPRAENLGNTGDSPLAPQQNTVIPAAPAAAAAVKTAPAAPGAQEKAAATGAEPQEAGLLSNGPAPAVPPLGLENALRRLKGLLADLATSRALLHALPVSGALVVLGGAAFGIVHWRRKRRLAKKDVPDDIADEKDTWLPGSGSLPPVDRA